MYESFVTCVDLKLVWFSGSLEKVYFSKKRMLLSKTITNFIKKVENKDSLIWWMSSINIFICLAWFCL